MARADLVPLALAAGEGKTPSALLHPHGVFLVDDEGGLTFSCRDGAYGDALFTATTPGGTLLAGNDGPWLTTNGGCQWERTSGAANARNIIGIHQTLPDHPRIVFGIQDSIDGSTVAVTTDGGFLSEQLGTLAVAGFDLTGLVGEGDVVVTLGVGELAGDVTRWVSADGGETFETTVVELDGDPPPSPVMLREGLLWFWSGATLHTLPNDGLAATAERAFESGPWPVAADSAGTVWVAAGGEGLWARDATSGAWSQHDATPASALAVHGDRLWVARIVVGPGDPLVVLTEDGGATWDTVVTTPESWGWPTGCESLISQACEADDALLRADLGLPPAEDDLPDLPEPEEPGTGGGGGGCGGAAPIGGPWGLVLGALGMALCRRRQRPETRGTP